MNSGSILDFVVDMMDLESLPVTVHKQTGQHFNHLLEYCILKKMNERKPHGTDPGSNTHNFSPGEGTRPRKHFLAARLTLADMDLSRDTHTITHTHMYVVKKHTPRSNPQQPRTHRSQDGFHLQRIQDAVFAPSPYELTRLFTFTIASVSVCRCVFGQDAESAGSAAQRCIFKSAKQLICI